MAKKRKRRQKRNAPSVAAPSQKEKGATGKAALAWGGLVAMILIILAVLEMVKEGLA